MTNLTCDSQATANRRFAGARGCAAPSDKFEKSDHPYDIGYWMRYDGRPMPKRGETRKGWEACDKELAAEAEAQHNSSSTQ